MAISAIPLGISTYLLFKPFNDLSQFEWSVRTSNVFEAENINLLSKLVSYNRHELLRLSNFGRNFLKLTD